MAKNTNRVSMFYCPQCRMTFFDTDDDGVAKCPICKTKRKDGLNQIDRNHFQCITCGCRLGNISKEELVCPNGCKKEEKNEK